MMLLYQLMYLAHFFPGVYLPNYDPNQSLSSYIFDFMLASSLCFLAFALGANFAVTFAMPRAPFFPCSVLPNSSPLFIIGLVCYLLPNIGIVVVFFGYAQMCILTFIYAMLLFRFILPEFCVNRKSYFSINKLRSPSCLLHEWRLVQILQQQINGLVGPGLVPLHSLISKLIVYSLYMMIRRDNQMSFAVKLLTKVIAFMSVTFWESVLFLGGMVHLYGRKILQSWKYNKWHSLSKLEKKILSKFRKSCCPISISFGRTYVIRRMSVLKFFRQISAGLLRSLLALNK